MLKHLSPIGLSLLCAFALGACAEEKLEQTNEIEQKVSAAPMTATEEAEAALLAERMPPGLFGDPKLSRAERVQQSIDKELKKIRDDGEGDALKAHANALANTWGKLGESSDVKFSVDKLECFKGGCSLVTRHASDRDLEPILNDLAHTEAFHRWNAGKFRSGRQELEGGGVQITWIFHAPPEGAPAMQPEEHYKNFDEPRSSTGKN